jgi:hypothetical protein
VGKLNLIEPGTYGKIKVERAWHPLVRKLKPFDLFCTQGCTFFSIGIRIITMNLSADREAEFNHTGLFPEGDQSTIEARATVTSNNFFEMYEGCHVLIARYTELTEVNRKQAMKKLTEHIDDSYPWYRIPLHLTNTAHIFHYTKNLVCSEFIAKGLFYAGARSYKYYGVTPDNLADEFLRELNSKRNGPKYDLIFKGKLAWLLYFYCPRCWTFRPVPVGSKKCCKCKGKLQNPLTMIKDDKYPIIGKVIEYNKKKIIHIDKKF